MSFNWGQQSQASIEHRVVDAILVANVDDETVVDESA